MHVPEVECVVSCLLTGPNPRLSTVGPEHRHDRFIPVNNNKRRKGTRRKIQQYHSLGRPYVLVDCRRPEVPAFHVGVQDCLFFMTNDWCRFGPPVYNERGRRWSCHDLCRFLLLLAGSSLPETKKSTLLLGRLDRRKFHLLLRWFPGTSIL